ncbi:phospholipase, partial [Acinetobacter baumannii]|nr:phospholipase [Acinetobacter baumannii]
KYKRYDTSMEYRGESLQAEIKTIYSSLEQRKL